ncbi:Na+/H+ antiporter NhaC [Lentilactobacillus sp. SPB1-3]|uniref:Na+/H+ antiporter NhaC n=1 Tax=Lentilactobacillus terminaliae TaxID=3003483 RepID=A0ACD5DDZ0_9LACO|nr:Na+/H+ antiporter NhaC [Lentilactobacillus sp. SPB1-3]MCZ0977504.1 Na+/H+ antiporter NhaC [Lentilactobacillus sp. SPB1-3]
MEEQTQSKVSLMEGSIILVVMLLIMGFSVIKLALSPEIPILLVIFLLICWAKVRHFSWSSINDGIVNGIQTGIIPIFIFILIGILISTWIASGVIPSLMVFGFHLISAEWFLPSVFIVCTIVGTAIGSAFTVISTVGIAFMGMGITMGMNPAMVAGAIISGAIFGDKTSPLSDSTNLASAVVDADLFAHIKNLMWSTIPAWLTSFVVFILIGQSGKALSSHSINQTVNSLTSHFSVSAWAFLPIALMFICAWIKIPAIFTLFINIVVATGMLFISAPKTKIADVVNIMSNGFVSHTGNQAVDALLSRGGVASMMATVSLIICALALGGLLMKFGIIDSIMIPLSKRLKSTGSLILAVILSGIGVNIFVGEQYLSVILPGNAFKATFEREGLAAVSLSRALEDGGTVINYLIPWGVAGVFAANALKVSTLSYLPFVIFSLASPIFSILSGYTGIGIKRSGDKAK